MEAERAAFRDASSQTERPEDLDEATKQDNLDSFAMELFLTSVMPRHDAHGTILPTLQTMIML